ncbi:hypothetical protein BM1_10840 [Bipolaris maydis]|nr:hypothetical protein BM1_10840 [Bipolaris maydis]
MKFTAFAIVTLLPLTTLSAPTAEAEGALLFAPEVEGELPVLQDIKARSLEKRAITGTVTADALKHRQCPRTSCTADGQFSRGTRIQIRCYTDTDTTVVSGNPGYSPVLIDCKIGQIQASWSYVLRMAVITLPFPLAIIPRIIGRICCLAVVASSDAVVVIEPSQFSHIDTVAVVLSRSVVEPIVGVIIRAGTVFVTGTGIDLSHSNSDDIDSNETEALIHYYQPNIAEKSNKTS